MTARKQSTPKRLPEQAGAKICFDMVAARPGEAALLIGAGCSVTAGIPDARTMVEDIRNKYSDRFSDIQAAKGNYAKVVSKLDEEDYLEMFQGYVDGASLNLAHLCIAELVRANVVNRVLTTNFDPLLVQACALAGVYPAIYDCVGIPRLDSVLDRNQRAIYYLHGQSYGLGMVNTDNELTLHSPAVKDVIQKSIRKNILIVVGCCSDPVGVMGHLMEAKNPRHIVWVPHTKADARAALAALKPKQNPRRWVLENYDADKFFYGLLCHLGLPKPAVLRSARDLACQFRRRLAVMPPWYPKTRAQRALEKQDLASSARPETPPPGASLDLPSRPAPLTWNPLTPSAEAGT